jgi:hypothetical protein
MTTYMEPLNIQLSIIKEMFPEQKEHVGELYSKDEEFRSLCDDYSTCIRFLHKFKKEFSEKIDSIQEYENVRKILEGELQEFLSKIAKH